MRVTTLTIAASVSVLVHLIALVTPAWHLPEDEDLGGKPLSALLLAAPVAEPHVPAPKPAKKAAAPREPTPPIADAATATLGEELAASSQPLASDAQTPSAQSLPAVEMAAPAPVPEAASAAVAEAGSAPL